MDLTHAGRAGLARRTRVRRVWALAPVHLGIAVAALLVAQARALPEVQADDLAFSVLAAAGRAPRDDLEVPRTRE